MTSPTLTEAQVDKLIQEVKTLKTYIKENEKEKTMDEIVESAIGQVLTYEPVVGISFSVQVLNFRKQGDVYYLSIEPVSGSGKAEVESSLIDEIYSEALSEIEKKKEVEKLKEMVKELEELITLNKVLSEIEDTEEVEIA